MSVGLLARAARSVFVALVIGGAVVCMPATASASEYPPPPPTSERPVTSSVVVKSVPVSSSVRVTVTVKAPVSR